MYEILENKHYIHRPACKMVSIFRFKGAPDFDKLKQAIETVMNKHELLVSKVTRDEDGRAFYSDNKEANVVVNVELFEAPDPDDDEDEYETMLDIALEWAQEEDTIPLNLAIGEYMHHGIFSDSVDTVWAISSHYLAGDAFSIQYLARDVLKEYENPGSTELVYYEQDSFNPIEAFESYGFNDQRQLKSLNKRWAREGKTFTWEEYQEMYDNFHAAYKLSTLTMSLDKETSQAIIKKAKAEDKKLSAVISAAFSAATEERESFAYPLSTRPEAYEGVGVYGGSVTVTPPIKLRLDTSLEATIERVDDELKAKSSDEEQMQRSNIIISILDGSLVDSAYYAAFAGYKTKSSETVRKMFSLDKAGEGMQINNLGELVLDAEYSFGELNEYYYIPSMIYNFRRGVSFITHDEQLFFTSTFYQKPNVEILNLRRFKETLEGYAK